MYLMKCQVSLLLKIILDGRILSSDKFFLYKTVCYLITVSFTKVFMFLNWGVNLYALVEHCISDVSKFWYEWSNVCSCTCNSCSSQNKIWKIQTHVLQIYTNTSGVMFWYGFSYQQHNTLVMLPEIRKVYHFLCLINSNIKSIKYTI